MKWRIESHFGRNDAARCEPLHRIWLEDDMIHLQGETYTTDANGVMQNRDISSVQINVVTDVTQYEEAPWLSKHGGLYYLTYASGFPESIAHATSSSPVGPWQYRGVILDPVPNSSTIHPAVFDFCGATYIAHHNGALPTGDSYRRSTCMDRVSFGSDGTIDRIPAN